MLRFVSRDENVRDIRGGRVELERFLFVLAGSGRIRLGYRLSGSGSGSGSRFRLGSGSGSIATPEPRAGFIELSGGAVSSRRRLRGVAGVAAGLTFAQRDQRIEDIRAAAAAHVSLPGAQIHGRNDQGQRAFRADGEQVRILREGQS